MTSFLVDPATQFYCTVWIFVSRLVPDVAFSIEIYFKTSSRCLHEFGFVAQEVRAVFPELAPITVSPGVEPQMFVDREVARTHFLISRETIQLLAVTRLVPRKGIDRLIEALAFYHPRSISRSSDAGQMESLTN